jgi:MFS family permease
MGRMQILIVVITVTLNMLDGFDVASIALATNGIMTEFGLTDRAQLGIVLAAELVGMAIGSIFLGGVADRFGRRPMMLGCLVVMSLGMFMVTREAGIMANGIHNAALSFGRLQDTQTGIIHILVWRVITGLGIGGMLAAINAVVAEYSNKRRKHLNVSIMAMGYPIGVAIGSQISSVLLVNYSWHSVFYLGFFWTLALLPIVYFFVPETVSWVAMKRPPGAVEKISATMVRLGHGPVKELPPLTQAEHKASVLDIFSPALVLTTILVTAAYFFHITTFYFVAKWVPYFVGTLGFDPSSAAQMLFWVSVGGATGGGLLGVLTIKYSLKALTIASMICSTVLVIIFGSSPADFTTLAVICFGAGFFTNATINGLYAIFAHCYPTHVRAVGTGFAIGVGRGGAVLGPTIAGLLLEQGGLSFASTAVFMSMGSLVAAGALIFLTVRSAEESAASR